MTTTEFDKKNCSSYDWCKENGPEELNCPDCDNYIPDSVGFVLRRESAMTNFDAIMAFQYGNAEESEKAFEKLKDAKEK